MTDEATPREVGSHDGLGPCAQVPVHPRHGRLWANVRPTGADTPVPSYPMDDLYDQAALDAAVAAVRERCAKLIEPKNPPSDWTPLAQYAADLARRIRTEA
jgi:hypothetical protein